MSLTHTLRYVWSGLIEMMNFSMILLLVVASFVNNFSDIYLDMVTVQLNVDRLS